MNNNSVAACVVTYCSPAVLAECVHALRSQTQAPRWIVVVDNSPDAKSSQADDESGIVRIVPGYNSGPAGGFDIAMREASRLGAHWFLLLNDDDVVRPEALARLLEAAITLPQTAGVIGRITAAGIERSVGGVFNRRVKPIGILPYRAEVDVVTFTGLLLRAQAYDDVGGLERDYFIMWEEYEFCFRLRDAGWHLVVLPEILVDLPSHVGDRRSPNWRRYYGARNGVLTFRKHPGRRGLAAHLSRQVRIVVAGIHEGTFRSRALYVSRGLLDGARGVAGTTIEPSRSSSI